MIGLDFKLWRFFIQKFFTKTWGKKKFNCNALNSLVRYPYQFQMLLRSMKGNALS